MGATFPAADGLWVCAGVIVESCHKRVQRAGLPTAGFSSGPLQGTSNDGSVLLCLMASLPETAFRTLL